MNNEIEIVNYKGLDIEIQYDEIGEEYIATCRCNVGTVVISGNTKESCVRDMERELDSLLDI